MTVYFFTAILFSVFTSASFFIKNSFFATAISTDLTALFSSVPYISIITIPALCYKSQLKEYNQFIPGSSFRKILKEFFQALSIYSVMVLMLIIPCIFVAQTGSIDIGQIFTSELCLILFGATCISLCIFLQEIISNSLLSLILSAVILAIINNAHSILVYVNANQFISAVIKTVSFAWHFDSASKGIIDTRDILFFAVITFAFLYYSDFIYNYQRGKILSASKKYQHVITGIICVLILCNSNGIYKRIDCSKSKNYSISKYSSELAKKIDDNLKITYYRSSNLLKYYPQIRDISDFLSLYSSQNKKISFTIKNPDRDTNLQNLLSNYGITSQQLRAIKNTSTEYINVYSAITLEYNGKTELIPFIMDNHTLEYDLDGRITHLITEKDRIVNIIVANGMNLQQDYSYVTPWLNSQGFLCNEINLYSSDLTWELENTEGPILVIGDCNLSEQDAAAIENYILSEKGNAFFAVSPYTCNIETDWALLPSPENNIIRMIENWGIEFLPQICADFQCSRLQLYSQDDSSLLPENNIHTENINYPLWIKIPGQENFVSGITLFWTVPLKLNSQVQNSIAPYLFTNGSSYYYPIDYTNSDSLLQTNPFLLRDQGLPENIKYENQIVAAQLSGNLSGLYNEISSSKAKIIVLSDQYFVNSLMIGYNSTDYADYRNFDFLTYCLLKLNNEEELADLQNKKAFDNSINKITEISQLIRLQITTYVVLFLIIPLIYLICFIVLSIKAKNRYKIFYKTQGK